MLKTDRISLIPLSLTDLQAIEKNTFTTFQIVQDLLDDEIFHWVIGIKIDNMKNTPKNRHDWFTYWAIIHENIIIGFIGFKGYPNNDNVEIGYSLSRDYRRNGFMHEALELLLLWTKESNLVHNVLADVEHENTASNKLLQKNGFRLTHSDDELHYYSKDL